MMDRSTFWAIVAAVVLGLLGVAYALADRSPAQAEPPHEAIQGAACVDVCERAGMRLDGMLWERGRVATCVCSASGRGAW